MLRSCCCGSFSLRTGSYVSAVYTLVYFLVFALLTGNYSYHEMRGPAATNHTLQTTADPETHHPTSEPSTPDLSGDLALLLVDFTCEIAGFFVSIMLIRGLELENKCYLIPWLVVVPLHTLIDSLSLANIVKVSVAEGRRDLVGLFLTLAFVLVDLTLNVINVYVFLVVLAQYYEYRKGRGTAAYRTWVETTTGEDTTCPGDPVQVPSADLKTHFTDLKVKSVRLGRPTAEETMMSERRSNEMSASVSHPQGRITAV